MRRFDVRKRSLAVVALALVVGAWLGLARKSSSDVSQAMALRGGSPILKPWLNHTCDSLNQRPACTAMLSSCQTCTFGSANHFQFPPTGGTGVNIDSATCGDIWDGICDLGLSCSAITNTGNPCTKSREFPIVQ